MQILVDPHTLRRAEERGATLDEIRDTILYGFPTQAKYSRLAKAKVFPFQQVRLGRYYEHKRVEVIYVEQEKRIVTVTVYVFYGKWSPLLTR